MPRIMYDSVSPEAIPRDAQMVAGYINGTWTWTQAEWDRFPNAVKVRIATRAHINDGHVLDVESGAAWPPSVAVDWVKMRRRAGVDPTIYCNELYDWPVIRELFHTANVREPHYWVARYNGVRAIPTGAIGRQFANPAKHGEGHYDLSIVADYWPGVDSEETEMTVDELLDAQLGGNWTLRKFLVEYRTGEAGVRDLGPVWDFFVKLRNDQAVMGDEISDLHDAVDSLHAKLDQLIGQGITLKGEGEIVVKPQ